MNKLLVPFLTGALFLSGCTHLQLSERAIPRKIENRIKDESKEKGPHKYAVLITGKNEKRFKIETGKIYENLQERGFSRNNIYVLDELGKENKRYHSDGIASKRSITTLFSHLERKVNQDDTLIVHISDHGDKVNAKEDSTSGWERLSVVILAKDIISELDLERCLQNVNPKLGIITTDVCYGGSIASRLGKGPYISISQAGEETYGYLELGNAFGRFFYEAFGKPKEADTNGDGRVSVYEAFAHARNKDFFTRVETVFPLIFSDYKLDPEQSFIE